MASLNRDNSSAPREPSGPDFPGEVAEELLPTRLSLLSRLKDWKDQEACAEFFEMYRRLVYQTARRTGMRDADAEDVVQETMASVFLDLKSGSYDPAKGSFKHWLLNCTRWKIRDWFRRKRARLEIERPRHSRPGTSTATDTIERLPDPAVAELERVWDEEWETAMLEAAIRYAKRTCDATDFQVFHYQVIKKNPISKVAKTFHLSRAKIYLARYRVRKVINKEIKRLSNELL